MGFVLRNVDKKFFSHPAPSPYRLQFWIIRLLAITQEGLGQNIRVQPQLNECILCLVYLFLITWTNDYVNENINVLINTINLLISFYPTQNRFLSKYVPRILFNLCILVCQIIIESLFQHFITQPKKDEKKFGKFSK
jgi:hypothetical protein